MRRRVKQFTLMAMIVVTVFCCKINVHAEKVFNTTGEKNPWGGDYTYKYWSGTTWVYSGGISYAQSNYPNMFDITYNVTYNYEEAYKMLDLVNAERRKAGVPELQAKDEIMQAAMKRAAETAIYWRHIRPDGSEVQSVSMFVDSENCSAGSVSAKDANESLVNSSGHYKNMIDGKWSYAGFGCVEVVGKANGYTWKNRYWVQTFCYDKKYYEGGYDAEFHRVNDKYVGSELVYSPVSPNDRPVLWEEMPYGNLKNYSERFTTKVNPQLLKLELECTAGITLTWDDNWFEKKESMYVRDKLEDKVIIGCVGLKNVKTEIQLSSDQYDVKVLTTELCSYKDGEIIALKPGKAKIQYMLKADNSIKTTLEIEIKDKPVKKGSKVTVSGNTYKVTNTKNRTVSFAGGKDTKTVTIPKTVKIQGKSYKVTSVAANAFKNSKNLTSVTIGANVTSIGSKAFYGCKNLKKITVKSTKLKSVGKSALKGIHKKAVVKVPKSKLPKYKLLFQKKGQKKTVKIKK